MAGIDLNNTYSSMKMPYSPDAEQAVLGAVLIDSECMARVAEILPRAELFHLEQHKLIYQVMLDFRNAKIDVLVATDVVARGIDVTDVPLVINYDVPHDPEDYIHRIGRTARAENSGEAITLVSPEDARYWNRIEQFLKKEVERVSLPAALGDAPADSAYERPKKNSPKKKSPFFHTSRHKKAVPLHQNSKKGKSKAYESDEKNRHRTGSGMDGTDKLQ